MAGRDMQKCCNSNSLWAKSRNAPGPDERKFTESPFSFRIVIVGHNKKELRMAYILYISSKHYQYFPISREHQETMVGGCGWQGEGWIFSNRLPFPPHLHTMFSGQITRQCINKDINNNNELRKRSEITITMNQMSSYTNKKCSWIKRTQGLD